MTEGLGEGDTFYTTSQSLALTSEVREYVYSDRGPSFGTVSSCLPWPYGSPFPKLILHNAEYCLMQSCD